MSFGAQAEEGFREELASDTELNLQMKGSADLRADANAPTSPVGVIARGGTVGAFFMIFYDFSMFSI